MRSDIEAPPTHGVGAAARGRHGWRPRWDSRRSTPPETPAREASGSTSTPEAAVEKVNLEEKFSRFSEHWQPKVVGELNGQQVKLAKVLGAFDWHQHDNEDELFLVVKGRLRLEMRDRTVVLDPGEFFIVPRGVEHRPVAEEEVHMLMFEPASTLNTGNLRNERTVESPERL
ncbi:cupin domain-containing protein [Hyalangium versicolor]|uniref:cupin domain-containing protein n=1 Tax=Hyalangium versicolor TaxID=2861190 RepID=UPI001CCCE612|nr:cupin domain-containing protein [Hyalangium versicolor]